LIMIMEVMATNVVTGEKEIRTIFSLAVRGIIEGISEQNAPKMISTLYSKLKPGFEDSKSEDVKEECVDILAQICKRFNLLLLKKDDLIDKDDLMVKVLNQLGSEKSSLRKKATNCIGALAVVLNGPQL